METSIQTYQRNSEQDASEITKLKEEIKDKQTKFSAEMAQITIKYQTEIHKNNLLQTKITEMETV